jgi:hypothetical protein
LSVLMAISLLAGACGPYFIVPIFAALFVWFTFSLWRHAGGPAVGIVAAIVLIVSPVVLLQAAPARVRAEGGVRPALVTTDRLSPQAVEA